MSVRTEVKGATAAASQQPSVLLAVDETPQAEGAFDFYLSHLHKEGNRVVLFHVIDDSLSTKGGALTSVDLLEEIKGQERAQLRRVENKFAHRLKTRKITVDIQTALSINPGEAIVKQAYKEQAVLVVMGTRGLGSLRRTLAGSASDHVLHHIHCPVAICKI